MFDSFITKCVQPKTISWDAPNMMLIESDDGNSREYEILKGACEYIHKRIGLKVPTSKELYKKADNIWRELRDLLLNKQKDEMATMDIFDLESPTMRYLTTSIGEIVDVKEFGQQSRIDDFMIQHQKFNIEITTMKVCKKFYQDCVGGLIKFICYDKDASITTDDYTPVVILEMNNEKSTYRVYLGIMIYKTFTIIPTETCYVDSNSLFDYISSFDMEYYLQEAKVLADGLYEKYKKYLSNPVEISAREVTALLKKVGCKLQLDDVDKLHPIDQISDEVNNQKIQNFYNTFQFKTGETACDILRLSEFRKTFRYNNMTVVDILQIISKEYLSYDGNKITMDILIAIIEKLNNNGSVDKAQVEQIEREQLDK